MRNLINYAVSKGIITFDMILKSEDFTDYVKQSLSTDDASAFYQYRIMNLGKLYPYIPKGLQTLLKSFTLKPNRYFTGISEFMEAYHEVLDKEFTVNG